MEWQGLHTTKAPECLDKTKILTMQNTSENQAA